MICFNVIVIEIDSFIRPFYQSNQRRECNVQDKIVIVSLIAMQFNSCF